MRILFWNTHRNENINPYVLSLVEDYKVDVLILAEYKSNIEELNNKLMFNSQGLIPCNTLGCNRIKIWCNYRDVTAGPQHGYYSFQIVNKDYIICSVHLFSDLHGDCEEERLVLAGDIMYEIKKLEEKLRTKKTLIIGDFNSNPYDRPCVNANGFHGLPTLILNENESRTVKGREYRKFYNPMWNLLGDFEYPPGTYYLKKATLNCPMWYILDQVFISRDLMTCFKKDELKIITKWSNGYLYDDSGHPDKHISDHFPIICEVSDIKEKVK